MTLLASFPRSFRWAETANVPQGVLHRQGWVPGIPACQHEYMNTHVRTMAAFNERAANGWALDFRKQGTFASVNNALAGVLPTMLGPMLVLGVQASPLIAYDFSGSQKLGDATVALSNAVGCFSFPNTVLSGGASDSHVYLLNSGTYRIQVRQAATGEFRQFPRYSTAAGRYLSGIQGEIEITSQGTPDLGFFNPVYSRFVVCNGLSWYSRATTAAITGQSTIAATGAWSSSTRTAVDYHVNRLGNTAIIFGKESDALGTLTIRHSTNGGTSFSDWFSVPTSGTDKLYARGIWYLDSTAKWYALIRRSNSSNVYQDHQIWSSTGSGAGWTLENSGYTGAQMDFAFDGVLIGENVLKIVNTPGSGLQVWVYNARTNQHSIVHLDTASSSTNASQRLHWVNGRLIATVVIGTTLHVYQTQSYWDGWPIT